MSWTNDTNIHRQQITMIKLYAGHNLAHSNTQVCLLQLENGASRQFFQAPLRQPRQTHLHHPVEVKLHAWNNQTLHIRPWCFQNHQPLFKNPACSTAEHSKVLTSSSAILNPEPQLNSDRGGGAKACFIIHLHPWEVCLISRWSFVVGNKVCVMMTTLLDPI